MRALNITNAAGHSSQAPSMVAAAALASLLLLAL
jgi:hypothetical protein